MHGITLEFLADKPDFSAVKEEIIEFLSGAELIIHNASFDVGFLDAELKRARERRRIADFSTVTDSLHWLEQNIPAKKTTWTRCVSVLELTTLLVRSTEHC